MIALLSITLVAVVPLAYAHGHASGLRQADADLEAAINRRLQHRHHPEPPAPE